MMGNMGAIAAFLLSLQLHPQRDPVREALGYLVAHQGSDGAWGAAPSGCSCRGPTLGGDLESTSWAILALEEAGYTELSQDELNGRNLGLVVRSGLEWLTARQDREGAFDRDHPAVNALAALVLTDSYGWTLLRKESAERAYAWVEKSEIKDILGRIRKGMVLHSGILVDIGTQHNAKILLLADALAREEGDLARWGSLLLKGFALYRHRGPVKMETVDALRLPVESLHLFATASLLQGDMERWHEWFGRLKVQLPPLQREGARVCEAGSWDGESVRERLRVTALRCLTLQHGCYYYRCPSRR